MERQWEIDTFRNGRRYTQDAARTKAKAMAEARQMIMAAFYSAGRMPKAVTAKISLVEYAERDMRKTIESYEMTVNVGISFKTRRTR